MEVLISSELEEDVSHYEKLITKAFELASRLENLQEFLEVSVTFVDDNAIRLLNRDYRSVDAPTDVLSFPQDDDQEFIDPEGMPTVLGDVVVSLERARSQAADYGHSIEREVVYLAVHGFFHLLGYDHGDSMEQSIMRGKEERVLGELDLGRD